MGLLHKLRTAFENHELAQLKAKISRLDAKADRQGKRVESLTVELHPRFSGIRSKRFEFVLSDGTTNKKPDKYWPAKPKRTRRGRKVKNPNRILPVEKLPDDPNSNKKPTLVGRSSNYYDECTWVEDYQPGVRVVLVVRKDGIRDILKVTYTNRESVPQNTIWWMENGEEVCRRFNVAAVRPRGLPMISTWTYYHNRD